MSGTLDFSQIVRAERDRMELTQQQLGQLVGVSDSYIAHIESGLKTPSLDVTIALAETFGFSSEQQQALLEALENSRLERSTRRIRTRGRAVRGAMRTMKRSGPGSVLLIDAETAAAVTTLAAGRDIRLLNYSPDGRWVAAADDRGAILVWDARRGEFAGNVTGHGLPVSAMAFLPDGSQLITATGESTLTTWDVVSGARIDQFETDLDGITAIATAADEPIFAVGDSTGRVGLWSAGEPEPGWTVDTHDGAIVCMALSADGEILATGGEDARVLLLNTTTGDEELSMEHDGEVVALCLSPDRQLLASGGPDGGVALWNATDGSSIRKLKGEAVAIDSLAFGTDGVTLAALYAGGAIVAWDTRTGAARRKHELKGGPYSVLAVSPDGRQIAAFDAVRDSAPDEYDPERIARDLATDRDLLAAYRDLKTAMSGTPEQRKAVTMTLRALARSTEA